MPQQFDRLSDSESHRQVGRTLNRAAGRLGGRRVVLMAAGALAAGALVGLATPSIAGNPGGAALSAPQDAAKPVAKPKASASAKANTATTKATGTNDDVDGSEPVTAPTKKASPKPTKAASNKPKEPIPATESTYAKNVPDYPPDGRKGRRIVYSKALMHVWIVNSKDEVMRHYPVTGRWDRPAKGVYKVYSMSRDTLNEHSKVTFRWMVRFAWGTNDPTASIGFHSIPIYYEDVPERGAKKGDRMTTRYELGLPVASGGCIRQADEDAEFLYRFAEVGDTVVVLPTAD